MQKQYKYYYRFINSDGTKRFNGYSDDELVDGNMFVLTPEDGSAAIITGCAKKVSDCWSIGRESYISLELVVDNPHLAPQERMELISQRICMTKDLGVNDNMFGGFMLCLLDESAAVYACRIADTPRMVTLKISEVLFKKAVKVGMLIAVYGETVAIGNTSLTVRIEVRKHNTRTGKQEIVCETSMTFVHIDEFDHPVPISERVKNKYSKFLKQ